MSDYKEAMYGSFFDELSSIQVDKLAKTAAIGAALRGVYHAGRLGIKDPTRAAKLLRGTYRRGAETGGALGGVGAVLKTPLGKAVGAGAATAVGVPAASGYVAGRMR